MDMIQECDNQHWSDDMATDGKGIIAEMIEDNTGLKKLLDGSEQSLNSLIFFTSINEL